MEPPVLAFALWIFAFLSVPAAGYPNGKVREACSSMMPCHGHSPQPSPEHTISVNETKFRPGDHIKVSLSGPVFEGFFIQARNAENLAGPAVGSFMLAEERISQLLTCGLVKNSAVSHTSKSKKTHVEAYWVAPTDAPEHVQFLATVVEKYKIFWVKIPGPIISQPNAPPLTTPTSITPETLPTSRPVFHLTTSFNASGCGITKFCIRNPPKCDPGAANCFFLSFKQNNHSVLIEMSGPTEGYIAFALSHDQWMVHRMLMLTTVLLTSIAFVLPFIYRGGWSEWAGFHPYLGCTVMALAIFQPLMAGFRPPPHAPRRQVFNWVHWSTGTTARILAVVTMFLGMDLPALNLPDPWDTYTMIGFVAWHVGIDILLEIHSYCLIRKVEVIDEDRIQILQSLTSAEAEGHTFKEIVLTIYICGNIAFLITFLAAIHQL